MLLLLLDLLWEDDEDLERLAEDEDDFEDELLEQLPDFPFSSLFLSVVDDFVDEFVVADDELFDFDEEDEELGSDFWIGSPNKFRNEGASLFFAFEVSCCKYPH